MDENIRGGGMETFFDFVTVGDLTSWAIMFIAGSIFAKGWG